MTKACFRSQPMMVSQLRQLALLLILKQGLFVPLSAESTVLKMLPFEPLILQPNLNVAQVRPSNR